MSNMDKMRTSLAHLYHFGLMKWGIVPAYIKSLFSTNDGPQLIFIAGLPKSGTTWLAQLLEKLPGYTPALVYDPDGCNENHDVCVDIFQHLPKKGHYVMKLHTKFSPSNMNVLERFHVRPVIMYRDIRDQCISRYYHVLNSPDHRHYSLYKTLSQDEAISHSIEIAVEYYLPWIENWRLEALKQTSRYLLMNYESLRQDTGLALSRVLAFYDINLSHTTIDEIARKISSQTKFDLRENLRSQRGTARKGVVGDWRRHFNSEHVRLMKERCGQHLIDLGYEKDFAWSSE